MLLRIGHKSRGETPATTAACPQETPAEFNRRSQTQWQRRIAAHAQNDAGQINFTQLEVKKALTFRFS
jgi:hypothetical protein